MRRPTNEPAAMTASVKTGKTNGKSGKRPAGPAGSEMFRPMASIKNAAASPMTRLAMTSVRLSIENNT